MKFTLSWLKEHLETDASLDRITDTLTMIGLELEGIENRAAGLEEFVVGHVLEAKRHPDADKLQVCRVDTGGEVHEVVCGAPNARTGLKGVFARDGLYIPGSGITLKKTAIRGVESCGMLLSEREMGLSDEHGGIVELPQDAQVGARAVDVMGLADPVIDIAITPNRGDCLGVRGIARDLAAAGLGRLKPLDTTPVAGKFKSPKGVALDYPAACCPWFVGRYIQGVKNGESPQWLKERLTAIGLRPISILVDITNLVSYDLCRPLHVFDAALVEGDILVRPARDGETLLALDGSEYVMDPSMTVIAGKNRAEALAGIMGGEESGCTQATTEVFLEVAWFDPLRIAATGRKLNLQSDARYRFERGVDPEFLVDAAEIATRLILELCGGEASEIVTAGHPPQWRRSIPFRPQRVKGLGGVDLPPGEAVGILKALGCQVAGKGEDLLVTPPSWRPDIEQEACLVEEVVRIHGYDSIPAATFARGENLPTPALDADQRRRAMARRLLAARGMVEVVSYSFLPAAQAELFGGGGENMRLVNPISSDLDVMRPSLLPNLIAAAGRNADRGVRDAAMYEVGPRFLGDGASDQPMATAGIRAGRNLPRHWTAPPRNVDFYDAKADALAVLAAFGVNVEGLQTATEAAPWYHPGRSGVLRLGPKNVLAAFGEIHPRVLKAMDVAGPVVGFEIFIENLPKPKARKGTAKPHLVLSPFQAVERDFAFVVAADVTGETMIRAVRGAEKDLIADVRLFDVFDLGDGSKSLAVSVTLQPQDRTLTEPEIEAVAERIVAAVTKATGGSLRG